LYVICQSDQTDGACNLSNQEFLGFGDTSVSSPAFAGIMALVNQQTGSRQGNANYVFYKLAAKDTLSSCNSSSNPASSCIFNDVTSGTNVMPCAAGGPNCTTTPGDLYGILTGYNAGTGTTKPPAWFRQCTQLGHAVEFHSFPALNDHAE
jgi:subtilase family serine protease